MAGRQRRTRSPALTPEGRESQLVSLAADLAERQLVEGTASAQVITHFLKLGSSRERAEQERIQNENLLLSAKIEQIASGARIEELYTNALNAMKQYNGTETPGFDEEDDDDRY